MSDDPSAEGFGLLGVYEYPEAKRLRDELAQRGARVELAINPETCINGGCRPKRELWIHREDIEIVKTFQQDEIRRNFGDREVVVTEDAGYDPTRETAKCPACLTEFSTRLKECPDCGLVFEVQE